jgi:hypothetical protein
VTVLKCRKCGKPDGPELHVLTCTICGAVQCVFCLSATHPEGRRCSAGDQARRDERPVERQKLSVAPCSAV